MKDACTLALDKDSRTEVTRGLSRLSELDFDNLSSLSEEGNERYPWDDPEITESINKVIEALPWNDPESFEDAINALSRINRSRKDKHMEILKEHNGYQLIERYVCAHFDSEVIICL